MEEKYRIRDGVLEAYTGREEAAVVPCGVHTIGTGAFKACTSLRQVTLPPGLRVIGENAFKGCRKLVELEIPEGVQLIGSYAFHRCHALQRIDLPDSVKEVGDCAFLYCDHLVEARLPGVKRLGAQMFLNDVRLERIELCAELPEEAICDMFTGCSRIKEILLAAGAHDFEEPAGQMTDPLCVRIPNAVEAAASRQEMPPLARRVVEDILKMMELEGRRLVRFLINLKHVDIPEGVQSLAKSCFFDKRGIVSVTLPQSLREIESRAFRNCISLERVELQGEQVEIREDAFRNCTSLKTIRLGDGREYQLTGLSGVEDEEQIPDMVCRIQKQVLGNFRLSGTILLKYLGAESRVVVPEGITRIGTEAFAGNEAIDRVILPDSLVEIGAEAFRDCLLLQSISFPERLCRIGAGAFEHCVKLLRANLPVHVTALEERTFRHCPALQEVTFPEGLTEIGEGAFYSCSALKKLVFPESLVRIGELAFYRCSALREVRLPAAAEQVESLAFAKSGVRLARIAGSGRAFGTDVFGSCPQLKTLVLEEGVRHLPDKIAYGCTALEQVRGLDGLESVGRHTLEESRFLECWQEKRNWGKNQEIQVGNGSFREKQELEVQVRGESFQDGQEPERKTGNEIFWDGRELEGVVVLPETVRIVAGGAFYGNQRVTEIYLPESVQFIGKAAFAGCTALRRLVLPAGIQEIEPELCSGCVSLEEVVKEKENGFVRMGERAFYQCRKLRSLSLEQTEHIGKEALAGCESLEKSTVHARLWAGERAFAGTTYVEHATTSAGIALLGTVLVGTVAVSGEECKGEISLPEGVTRIAPYAFAGNRDLTGITLPNSLEEIGEGAFFGCSGLKKVTFPAYSLAGREQEIEAPDTGREQGEGTPDARRKHSLWIGDKAFEKCSSLREIETTAEQIGIAAFSFCTSLKRIVLSEVTQLSDRLLEGCAALEECVCEKAKEAGERSFCGCEALEHFPFAALRRIGRRAFEGCDSLRMVTLQKGVFLARSAFQDCGRLERVELIEPVELAEPVELVQSVRKTGEAGQRSEKEEILPAKLYLQEAAFSGCTALRTVQEDSQEHDLKSKKSWVLSCYRDILREDIPEVVRRIWDSAFQCFEVEGEERICAYRGAGKILHIPEGIRRIEAEVFRNCTMLREVTFPESLEYIGARAFHGTGWLERQRELPGVERLKQRQPGMVIVKDMLLDASACEGEVTVPADIRLVCGWAFANGLKISSIRFRSERTRVGEYAFRNCVFLEKIILPDGTEVVLQGLSDRERDLPPLAKQAAMDSLNCFKTDDDGVLVECTGNIPVLRLAEGITAIGDGAFQDGNLLTKILFARSVQKIGRRAFEGCKWLEEVCQAEEVREIGEQAFSGCGRLKRIELSGNLERIRARAFENCTSLEEIQIPEGIVEIPERTFYRCHRLKKVVLPSTVERIGKE